MLANIRLEGSANGCSWTFEVVAGGSLVAHEAVEFCGEQWGNGEVQISQALYCPTEKPACRVNRLSRAYSSQHGHTLVSPEGMSRIRKSTASSHPWSQSLGSFRSCWARWATAMNNFCLSVMPARLLDCSHPSWGLSSSCSCSPISGKGQNGNLQYGFFDHMQVSVQKIRGLP